MSASFAHLHVHSYYSLLDGVASPQQLAEAAAQLELPALALTDHASLSGAIEFFDACRARGVRPIIGLELHVAPPAGGWDSRPAPLVLLAEDLGGWRSLCRLSTAAHQHAPGPGTAVGEQAVGFEQLAAHAQGLVCLTGGRRGTLARLVAARQREAAARWLGQLGEVFAGGLYVELTPNNLAADDLVAALAAFASQVRLPSVATNNVHLLAPNQAELQQLLTAIRLIIPLADLPAASAAPAGSHLAGPAQMQAAFGEYPEALATTLEVAERCRLDLPLGVPHYPEIGLPTGETSIGALRARAEAGARERYGDISPAIRARLEHELAVIGERGYAPLFLIMQTVLAHARRTGVPTSSRGSAASSLVAYCLGITTPDPLRLDLYFERFLNPARASPPDIDTDLCSRRRDGVIKYVYDTYGAERVAMVATVMRFRDRSALRETAKALGFTQREISELARALPYRWGPPGLADTETDEAAADPLVARFGPFVPLARQYSGPRYERLYDLARQLLRLPRHLSVHPGGVVISPGPMTDLAPRQLAAKGVMVTQFDLGSVARLGLVKIDLLGIRGLSVLGDMAATLGRQGAPARPAGRPASAPDPLAALEDIPYNDPATSELVRHGRTIGCFQIESPGMRATLKEVAARSVDDVMVALALYRPGPLTGGQKDAFVRRHLGRETAHYVHPCLAPVLGETHGVLLYQEQVLRVAHEVAGFSLAEADLLRRAMSHFDPGKEMQTLRQKFVAGAHARRGVPAETAQRLWDQMAAFAGYGFPKAHAAAYAVVAWRAAWCKAHFPAEFLAAVLANWGGYYGQGVYLNEARRLGLRLLPPDVNLARREFSLARVDGQACLVMGLNQVQGLTARTAQRMLRERPFASLSDWLARADPRPQEADRLARVGALAAFGSIPAVLGELKRSTRQPGQMSLFGLEAPAEDDWSLRQKVEAQEAILGASVVAHRLELETAAINAAGALTTVSAAAHLGQRVRVAGMRQAWSRTATARGDVVYFMALEDLEGMLPVVISRDVYRRCKPALATAGPYVLEGRVELDRRKGEPVIYAEQVWSVGSRA